ncbi:MAG: hypothetical protein J6W62_07350 [Spirochaetia bacterium]|nr:hypothetical protein [Spirochaetia bacterium]
MFSPGTIIAGRWSNPYLKDKNYFGNLFIYEEKAVLKIYFSQDQLKAQEYRELIELFKDNKSSIFYGYHEALPHIYGYTLVDNHIKESVANDVYVFYYGELCIETRAIYEGIILEKYDEKIIAKAVLKTSYANKWIPSYDIKMNSKKGRLPEQISYSLKQKTYHIFSTKTLDIDFISGLNVRKEFNVGQKIVLQNEVRIEISAKTKINLETVMRYITYINSFIMLCSGNNSDITDVELYYDYNQKFPNKCWFKTTKGRETKYDNIIDFNTITQWDVVFSRWNNLCLKRIEILNMLFYILRFPEKFIPEMKTENLVHIFEGLMRYKYGKIVSVQGKNLKLFNPNKNYTQEIISSGNLLGKFIFFFLENKRQFFHEDFKRFALSDTEATYVSFIQNCITLRDYFSHGGFDERIKTINPILLNAFLLKAVRILLIHDILGISDAEIPLERI